MGRSAGPGSPIQFLCAAQRRDRWRYRDRDGYVDTRYEPTHDVVRTGRTKPRQQRGAIGQRNMHTAHEYRCSCGHVGWSTHRGVLHFEVA